MSTATSTTTAFHDYQNHLAGMDESAFIGSILYFEFRQPQVTRDELEAWFLELGLDDRFLPNPIRPIEAFKRATGVTARHTYDLDPTTKVKLWTEQAKTSNDDRLRKHIIREVLDAKGDRIEFNTIGECVFNKASRAGKRKGVGGESVQFTVSPGLDPADEVEARAFIDAMHTDYRFFYSNYYTQAIRDMVRSYIESLNAISVRSGGAVYFIHQSRWSTVNRLVTLVNDRIGNGCRIHAMPLLDTEYQRDMLSQAYQDEVEGEVEKLLGMVARVNEEAKGKKIPAKKYAELQEAWQDISSRGAEYTSIFDQKQERAANALELALDALIDMATRLDTGGKA